MIDIQLFTKKNETWKIKQRFWKRIEILCDKLQFVSLIGGGGVVTRPPNSRYIYNGLIKILFINKNNVFLPNKLKKRRLWAKALPLIRVKNNDNISDFKNHYGEYIHL